MEPSANLTIQLQDLRENLDDFFLVTNGVIVAFMQAGFACLESGAVRSKNTTNIMMKNFLDLFICGVAYFLMGFGLAYGNGGPFLGASGWAHLPQGKLSYWFFQFIFAATAATILSGAVAERCNFVAYIVYSFIISGFTYPIVCHWAWHEEGWLRTLGYTDFSGSGVVHVLAGTCSFVGAFFLGPRLGRFPGSPIPGHSGPLVGIGSLLLVAGFLAFNGGSLGHISQAQDGHIVARSIIITVFGGSGGALVALLFGRLLGPAPWPFSFTINATLAGMVSICGGPDVYSVPAAMLVGFLGALVYLLLHHLVLALKVDDPLDASALHFGAGAWGVIARPFFNNHGLVYGYASESFKLLGSNVGGLSAITAWSVLNSVAIFGGLKLLGYLRVSEEQELEGLDLSKHGEAAYPASAWTWHQPSPGGDEKTKGGEVFKKVNYDNHAFQMEKSVER